MSHDKFDLLRSNQSQAGESAHDEKQRRRAEKQRQRFQERQLEAIRQRIERAPLMKKRSERLQVANNMWRIMKELEKAVPPIRKRDVLHAAGQGSELDSTKRLPRFAIDPDLPAAEQEDCAEAATQAIGKYVEIARAAARLSGERHPMTSCEMWSRALVSQLDVRRTTTWNRVSTILSNVRGRIWRSLLKLLRRPLRLGMIWLRL
ncbi:hypothetical protein IB244_18430 [Rhizobium sp. RHZ02]|nr:hypothetical protein [Rhizobium sp. RHZ02]